MFITVLLSRHIYISNYIPLISSYGMSPNN